MHSDCEYSREKRTHKNLFFYKIPLCLFPLRKFVRLRHNYSFCYSIRVAFVYSHVDTVLFRCFPSGECLVAHWCIRCLISRLKCAVVLQRWRRISADKIIIFFKIGLKFISCIFTNRDNLCAIRIEMRKYFLFY